MTLIGAKHLKRSYLRIKNCKYSFQGPLYNESIAFLGKVLHQHFKKITQANLKLCGSGHNGIVEVEEGITMCARYKKKKIIISMVKNETLKTVK